MDSIKGAQELTRLLNDLHGEIPEPARLAALDATAAAPLFHWLGIEPPLDPPDADGTEIRSGFRFGRRRRG